MMHALPGMGADSRMFPGPWGSLPGFAAHEWPRHNGEQTLAATARTVCAKYAIRDGDVMIGASLGGMVACEIAKIRKLRGLYLIGSAISPHEVNSLLAAMSPLAEFSPFGLLRFSALNLPFDLAQMFSGIETSFVRAMCAAVFQWDGLGSTPVRCFRLHGSRDLVIPPPLKADLLLDGGHLISITHTEECVEFIKASERG